MRFSFAFLSWALLPLPCRRSYVIQLDMQPRELANCLINCHGIPGHARWHILGPVRASACVFVCLCARARARTSVLAAPLTWLTNEGPPSEVRRTKRVSDPIPGPLRPTSRPSIRQRSIKAARRSEWRQVQVRCRSGQGGRRINNRRGRIVFDMADLCLVVACSRRQALPCLSFLGCEFFLLSFLFILVAGFGLLWLRQEVWDKCSSYLEGAYALHCSCKLICRSFPPERYHWIRRLLSSSDPTPPGRSLKFSSRALCSWLVFQIQLRSFWSDDLA